MNEIWFAMSKWDTPDDVKPSHINDTKSEETIRMRCSNTRKKHRIRFSKYEINMRKKNSPKRKLTPCSCFKNTDCGWKKK